MATIFTFAILVVFFWITMDYTILNEIHHNYTTDMYNHLAHPAYVLSFIHCIHWMYVWC